MSNTSNKIIAFFDVDYTLINCNSGVALVKLLIRKGKLPLYHLIKTFYYNILYKLDLINYEKVIEEALNFFNGKSVEELKTLSNELFDNYLRKCIYKEAVDIINHHKNNGNIVVLISSSGKYIVEAIAHFLKIPFTITTEVITENGKLTNKYIPPLCYGEGKKILAEKFAQQHNISLKDCYFYTDSKSDLPLLLSVGHKIVVNPDPLLKKIALKNKWPVLKFENKMQVFGNYFFFLSFSLLVVFL